MSYPHLFQPLKIGPADLPNRVFMAPLTRLRSREPGDVPVPMMGDYYAQRASAGLIFTEATQVSFQAKGYSGAPGLHSDPQIAAWSDITKKVHEAGGHIAVQLWHTGRVSHASLQPDGTAPISASALRSDGMRTSLRDQTGEVIRGDTTPPREATTEEIAQVVADFAHAAASAQKAGFDLAEIHGAHGYLINQFLSPDSNHRTDAYGGSAENRRRLALEVIDAMSAAWSADRLGIRLSPSGTFNGTANDLADRDDFLALVAEIEKRGLSFIHISEPDWIGGAPLDDDFRKALRKTFSGAIIGAGAYTPEKAEQLIGAGLIDAAAFGRAFLANPDLPRRYRDGLPLNPPRNETFYANGPLGYTDYPSWDEVRAGAEHGPAKESVAAR